MMRKIQWNRLVCLGMAALMILSLCACAKREAVQPAVEAIGTKEMPQTADWQSVFDKHAEINAAIGVHPEAENSCRVFLENTQFMQVLARSGKNEYRSSLNAAYSVLDGLFSKQRLFYLEKAKSGELSWTESSDTDVTKNRSTSADFYANLVPVMTSPLSSMFQADSLTEYHGLTVLVTNFMEPNFNLSPFRKGVEAYMQNNPESQIAFLAISSEIVGTMYYPQINAAGNTVAASVVNLENRKGIGPVTMPFYIILLGPKDMVKNTSEELRSALADNKISVNYNSYQNYAQANTVVQPLSFDMIKPIEKLTSTVQVTSTLSTGKVNLESTLQPEGAKEETGPANRNSYEKTKYFASMNIGTPTRVNGAVFLAGVQARSSGVTNMSEERINLIASNYDPDLPVSLKSWKLYTMNDLTGQWVESTINEAGSVRVEEEIITIPETRLNNKGEEEPNGNLVENGIPIQLAGTTCYYINTALDKTKGILKEGQTYRIEICLDLKQASSPDGDSILGRSLGGGMESLSISDTEYLTSIANLSDGKNYIGSAPPQARTAAAAALAKTVNLSSLLSGLESICEECVRNEVIEEYVNIVFRAPEVK